MVSMAGSLKPIDSWKFRAPRQFRARDGASLQYYAYPAETDKVAVLVHGSAGPGTSMHALAEALRAAGVTAYVLDIRGHGGSGRRGDIDYIGQIDDDLADFVAELGPARSGETRTLVGFSAGAGFAIRFAGGPYGALFDRYVFLSPILPGSAAWRPNAGGWVNIALPRLITIAYLGRAGIHWFDGFPVISYAVSRDPLDDMTASYSYRLSMNFGAGRGYESLSEKPSPAGRHPGRRCRRAGGRGPTRAIDAAPRCGYPGHDCAGHEACRHDHKARSAAGRGSRDRTRPLIVWGRQTCRPQSRLVYRVDRLMPVAATIVVVVVIVIVTPVEIEHVEQVADRRHVDGNIGIFIFGARIGQVIAAALAELAEIPVPFDEFHERRMFAIDVGDVTAARERRNRDHRNPRPGAEEIDRLDEAGVVVSAAFIHGDENRRAFPLLLVALGKLDDVLGEFLEQIELRRCRMAVHGAVRLGVGHRRQACRSSDR